MSSVLPIEMLRLNERGARAPARQGGILARDIPPIGTRLPPEMREHLRRAALANCRSLSAEIKYRLAASIEGESFDAHGCIVKLHPAQGKALGDRIEGGQ